MKASRTAPRDSALFDAAARAHCTAIIKEKAHSFHFASRFLPRDKRQDVFVLYAFCRTVDDLVDNPQEGVDHVAMLSQLDDWRRWLLDGAPDDDENLVKHALSRVVRTHDLPLQPLVDLVDCVRSDAEPLHIADMAGLEHYCYGVAGTVGIVMAALLGASDPAARRHACDLGTAMQLTNVLRDVGEDLQRGRIYLPADEMDRLGYTRVDLEQRVMDERFIRLMRRYVEHARCYYESGIEGLRLLPRDSQFPIAVAARTYAGILEKIEQAEFDVFTRRAHTGRRDKLVLAARLYAHRLRPSLLAAGI